MSGGTRAAGPPPGAAPATARPPPPARPRPASPARHARAILVLLAISILLFGIGYPYLVAGFGWLLHSGPSSPPPPPPANTSNSSTHHTAGIVLVSTGGPGAPRASSSSPPARVGERVALAPGGFSSPAPFGGPGA